jgi:catechol 2,3-dioxygenase-like lactoylglutathione lyase family enzyme
MPAEPDGTRGAGPIGGVDHIALPLEDAPAMIAFYRALGLEVTEGPLLIQVHLGSQMINFHRPELLLVGFKLRARAAAAPCGDICIVWEGSAEALHALLDEAGAEIIEGPVERDGGRRTTGTSVYVRDPDGNLLEFLTYPDGGSPDAP